MTNVSTISAEGLRQADLSKAIILDVRTQMEHDEKHIGASHAHVPLDELNPKDFMSRHGLDQNANVYILCRSGKRATKAAEQFVAAGYHQVQVIEGGIIACEACGHEIKGYAMGAQVQGEKSKCPISLERQVRIAAGAIAATGALLSLTLNPLFAMIPLLVGGGLVFAGITDRCGLALVLTKAPWNQKQGKTCASASRSALSPAA